MRHGNLDRAPYLDEDYGQYDVIFNDEQEKVSIEVYGEGYELAIGNDHCPQVEHFDWQFGDTVASMQIKGYGRDRLKVYPTTMGCRIKLGGVDIDAKVLPWHIADLWHHMPVKVPPDMSRFLLCPMPGQVVRVDVAEGDIVEDGQTLAIVEAMKMENVLKAEKRARVGKVHVVPGAVLAVDQVMIEFEAV
ncbi:biotin/lipoyl-containing protein [Devosia sp. Root635]|uniref:biotin/lipoyl-containing protein n=1 Tax=Devosia sp. Root635 TaxID=1736575 RepID=UPI0039B79081